MFQVGAVFPKESNKKGIQWFSVHPGSGQLSQDAGFSIPVVHPARRKEAEAVIATASPGWGGRVDNVRLFALDLKPNVIGKADTARTTRRSPLRELAKFFAMGKKL